MEKNFPLVNNILNSEKQGLKNRNDYLLNT